MDQDFEDDEYTFSTNPEDNNQSQDSQDIERLWDRIYRICTKQLISQGLQFESKHSKEQLQAMVEKHQAQKMLSKDLIIQLKHQEQREKTNVNFMSECLKRYLMSYQIFQIVGRPDFYDQFQEDDDDEDDGDF